MIFIFPPFHLYGYNKALSRLKKKYTVTPAIKYSIFIIKYKMEKYGVQKVKFILQNFYLSLERHLPTALK